MCNIIRIMKLLRRFRNRYRPIAACAAGVFFSISWLLILLPGCSKNVITPTSNPAMIPPVVSVQTSTPTLPGVITPPSANTETSTSNELPYIPPSYYSATEVTTADLINAYFWDGGHPKDPTPSGLIWDGKIFVFKNCLLSQNVFASATADYLWVGSIQCYFLSPDNFKQLSANEMVDIVGIDSGVDHNVPNSLLFTGCVIIPAGSVQLPVAGSPPFTYMTSSM